MKTKILEENMTEWEKVNLFSQISIYLDSEKSAFDKEYLIKKIEYLCSKKNG